MATRLQGFFLFSPFPFAFPTPSLSRYRPLRQHPDFIQQALTIGSFQAAIDLSQPRGIANIAREQYHG